MPKLSEILHSVRSSADYRRARTLAANDYRLIGDLIKVRKDSGLKQRDVAERLGVSQQAVSKIESYDSDPKLSTLRMYANAVGALVAHAVERDAGQLADGELWNAVAYVALRPQAVSTPASTSYKPRPVTKFDLALAA